MRKLDKNLDITRKAAQCGLFLYEVAERLHIADTTFSKWLRRPVADELRQRIFQAIEELERERKMTK